MLISKVKVMDHEHKVLSNVEKQYLSKKGIYFVLFLFTLTILLFGLGDSIFVKEIQFVSITYIFEFIIYIFKSGNDYYGVRSPLNTEK